MSGKLAKAEHFNRTGAVRYVVNKKGDGEPLTLTLGVAYEEAPVPEHYYVADYYQVIAQDFDVLMIFGKLDHPNLDRLRNKVEVYFPVQNFVRQLWKSSRVFQKTLEQYVTANRAEAVPPGRVSAQAEKVQTLQSNNVFMIQATGDCILDFFYISPKDLWLKPQKNEPIGIEALVRVMMSASVLLGFMQQCDTLANELIERFAIELEEENAALEPK